MNKQKTIGDYDIWYQPCEYCGYDTGKSRKLEDPRCWKCGRRIKRDYSKRALKQTKNTKTMSKIERVKIKNDLRLHISKTYGKKVLNNFAGSEQEDICLNIILNFIEHLQMTEYSENTINVSYISEEEYLRVKIDELLPSKELQRYFYNKLTEVFEMGLSRDAFDANNSESVLPYLDLEVAKEMVNYIKSKLTEK